MPDEIIDRLSRFTPTAGGINRDALLFEAGRASVHPSRGWKVLATALVATQALSLALMLPHFAVDRPRGLPPTEFVAAPSTGHEPTATLASPDPRFWSAHLTLQQLDRVERSSDDTTFIDSVPRSGSISPRSTTLMN